MSSSSSNTDARAARLVEAAAWRTHLTERGVDSSEAFESWLAADEANRAAWRQVQAPWDFLGEHAVSPQVLELRRAALAQAQRAGWWKGRTILGSPWLRRAMAAAVVGVALLGYYFWQVTEPKIYQTGTGERRVVTLDDGSQIALDSQTEVRVQYSSKSRDLILTAGQARFDVARDVERPFAVTAGGQKVVAMGTAFNVDLLGSHLFVTLIEGRVVVLPRSPVRETGAADAESPQALDGKTRVDPAKESLGSAGKSEAAENARKEIELAAGQQLVISPDSAPNIVAVDPGRATAWESGQLVFENEALATVIARVNRYSRHIIAVADSETAQLRISGVFRVGDTAGFVSTLTHYLPVQAAETEDGSVRLSHR